LALEPKNILVQSLIDESKPGCLPVSDSIFSWRFGRVGDRHILEEPVTCVSIVEGGGDSKKKMEVTGSLGPSVPTLKVK
jgi:hypothetical protein